MHPDLPAIMKIIAEAGSRITLTTSTTRLGDHIHKIDNLVDHYLISLDGADDETYRASRGVNMFHHVVNWIQYIVDRGQAEVAVSCVLQKSNIRKTKELYELCVKLGVKRLFFRVPDLKSHSFGREMRVPKRTLNTLMMEHTDIEILRQDLDFLQEIDTKKRILGQSRQNLFRKVQWLYSIVENREYDEQDAICDVPLTSFVIEPNQILKPCFYLPQRQFIDESVLKFGELVDAPVFGDVYTEILNNSEYRKMWCHSCQQFDGQKHPI